MRMSQLFGHTLRESPADAEQASHQLLVRAAFIRPLAAGLYTFLPLGQRVARRIEAIMREEMEGIGAQEILMPVLHPAELWQATGRWESTGPALMRLKDRSGHDYALAMTHEEVVAELARREIRSYRDLPRVVYHIQTKMRDEPRPRGGLIRVREFRMKDAYSLHTDSDDIDRFYPLILEAYSRIFARCALHAISVQADSGMMGGADSHEFMLPHPQGEDRLFRCPACGYGANAERATFTLKASAHPPLAEVTPIATPGCATIADVAAFVGVPTQQTLKAVFYAWKPAGTDRFTPPTLLLVAIRGDREVNETKLLNLLGGGELRAATDDEIRAAGAEPGYGSPVGLAVRQSIDGAGVLVVGDRSIQAGANLVAGANRPGFHLTGVNYPRDLSVTLLADVAQVREGDPCPRCGQPLHAESAIELGHCFKLGTRYAERLGATYLDAAGQEHPIVMGSYGIGVGRLMAAVVEEHHDEAGIIWPPSLAPFDIHLVTLARADEDRQPSEDIYQALRAAGLSVLYDDRDERAGVKFNDADLIGCPLRVTISRRSLKAGGAEVKTRWEEQRQVMELERLPQAAAALLDSWPSL